MEALAVLCAALLHASWNGMLKHSSNQTRSLVLNRAVAASVGLLFIFFLPPLSPAAWPYLLAASAIHLVYFFSLLGAYRYGDFSQVYPVSRGLAPIFILALGLVFGFDTMLAQEIVGVILVSIGILLLVRKGFVNNTKPLAYALLTAICITGYSVSSGLGVRISQNYLVYIAYLEFISGCLFVFSALLTQGDKLQWQTLSAKSASIDFAAGLMALGGFGVALWAMSTIPIPTVAALRETSVIFAIFIAWFVLKEPLAKGRLIAALVVFSGIVCIFLT
ncbi:EamA family transporter [Agaribacter flavus]|uniref:EamA family transporter n=1 Tax=Agaribacter flavus TaxID=1902781 RepID=A0ABV7FQC5_9ALTE